MKKSELKSMIKEMMLTEARTSGVIDNIEDMINEEWHKFLSQSGIDLKDYDNINAIKSFYKMTNEYIKNLRNDRNLKELK